MFPYQVIIDIDWTVRMSCHTTRNKSLTTILFPWDQKLAESQFSPTHASTKKDNERNKT